MRKMSSKTISTWTWFYFIAICTGKEGFVNRVFDEMKSSCPGSETKYFQVPSQIQCIHRCVRYDGCSKINYNMDDDVKYNCEVLIGGACSPKERSKHWRTVTVKSELFPKPKVYKSCKELLSKSKGLASGVYQLQSGLHFCNMDEVPGCGGGGWTLAMKVNGSKETFLSASEFWTSNTNFNTANGIKSFYENEAKFPAFSKIAFDEICIGMKVSSDIKWHRIPKKNSSLLDIFKSGGYVPTTLGRAAWVGIIASSSLQNYCNREGFNAQKDDGTMVIRLGIFASDKDNCKSTESHLGLGSSSSSCCNIASSSSGYKKGMGYILVK